MISLGTVALMTIMTLGLLAGPLRAEAQEATKIPQLVYFSMSSAR